MNELALFAGAGGGILGGHLLGWKTICAVERDAYAAQVLAQRQNNGILRPFPILSDVCSFDGKPWRGIVDVVSGDFRARTSAQPVAAQVSMVTNQAYGKKWQESSMRYDLITSSWKTHRSLLEEGLCESSVTLQKLGLIADGVAFQQKNLARLISETVCGWSGEMFATPQARDYRSGSLTDGTIRDAHGISTTRLVAC